MAFQGTSRFELVQKLGEGGMGVVYEAFDRERDMRIALKTLRNLDASSLYRFKREFRALSDISHTNIIGLYELVSERDDWFFTMELIDGVDFVRYARPDGFTPPVNGSKSTVTAGNATGQTLDTRVMSRLQTADDARAGDASDEHPDDERWDFRSIVDERRLRRALVQLAKALDALHRAGMVHRDLKPSNVRVTPAGRVVLMDFGIVAEITYERDESSDAAIIGTPAYMSPEQAAGAPASAAADWYSFGVLLYLAVTGRLPFGGRKQAMLLAKQTSDAPAPDEMATSVPDDLASLCVDLLARDPADRPHGHEVLRRLGVASEEATSDGVDATTLGGLATFVGREAELTNLHEAYDTMRTGQTVAVFCVGVSGMGKSTLVRRFLHELEARKATRDAPVVMRGRCHERESLPYKAFDTIVDHLSHFLLGLSPERVAQLLPEEVDLVTRLFPVLRRVPGVQTARPLGGLDPQELRVRAFTALREMLRRIAQWRPLIVYIDDLQWADRDSLDLLLELTREPGAPELLLVASVRAENIVNQATRAEGVVALMNAIAQRHACKRLTVGPLSSDEQRELVAKLLGGADVADRLARNLWADSAGSPLFLNELVRYLQDSEDSLSGTPPNLDEVIMRRVGKLPIAARQLLEVVAIAGEPTSIGALAAAIDENAVECERASAVLRVSNLARVAHHGKDPWLTAYHDRVREAVTAHLSRERTRDLHQRLAQALERTDEASVDALARHWLAAGDAPQAQTYLVSAAESAAGKLAFGRAADLYAAALDLGGHTPEAERELVVVLAGALANAGRCYEAADMYQRAADATADEDDAADLTRLAADNLLRCGRIVEGLDALDHVVRDLGIRVATTRRRALTSLVVQRARITLRGYRYKKKSEADVPARDLGRLDTLYAASTSLGMIDHIRGADLQTRHLVTALKFGEERRVCRALAIEAVFRASFGGRNARIAARLSRDAESIARRLGEPYLIGVSQLGTGAVAFFGARPNQALAGFAEAERILQSECVGADWERITARYFRCQSQVQLGHLDQVALSVERILGEADRRSDVYARNLFKTQPSMWRWLVLDKPERALLEVSGALEGWPANAYYIAHHFATISKAIAMQYQGRYQEVVDHLTAAMPDVKRSMIARVPWSLGELYALVGRCGVEVDDRAATERAIKLLAGMGFAISDGVAAGLRGALAARQGRADEAHRLLLDAVRLTEESHYGMYHAGYKYRLAELTPGNEGRRMEQDVLDWLAEKGIVAPLRMIDFHAPSYKSV